MFKKFKGLIITVFSILLLFIPVLGVVDSIHYSGIDPEYVTYTTFYEALESKTVYAMYVSAEAGTIKFQYRADIPSDFVDKDPLDVHVWELDKSAWYYTNYTSYDKLVEQAAMSNCPILRSKFTRYLSRYYALLYGVGSVAIIVLLGVVCLSYLKKMVHLGEGKFQVCKTSSYHYSDVIGHDEVIDDIKQYVSLLRSKENLAKQGIKTPRGLLFSGEPGTGKTLLAKAMAGEAKLPFIYLNAANCIEMYVGVGAKTIRSCFKTARELAPCIVFIDELDAIGNKRGSRNGSSEDTQTLLQLLQELDGFQENQGILVIAATNSPDTLDAAIKRAGRFDREIKIGAPRTREVREALLKHYTRKMNLAEDVDLANIASQLSGMTGADIASICNEAGIISVNKGIATKVTMEMFSQAIDKLLLKGNRVRKDKLKKPTIIAEKDRELVAYHEAGHAVVCWLQQIPISRISIQGTTSGVGGFVMQEDNESQFHTEDYLKARIRISYGGRCSERIKFGSDKVTTGAQSDITNATNMLIQMVGSFGFDKNMGMLDLHSLSQSNIVESSRMMDALSKAALELEADTMKLLSDNYNLVEKLAQALLERETMLSADVTALLSCAS